MKAILEVNEVPKQVATMTRFLGVTGVLGASVAAGGVCAAIWWWQSVASIVGMSSTPTETVALHADLSMKNTIGPPSFVTLWTDGDDCVWADDKIELREAFSAGRELTLTQGVAELQFGSGARAVVEAPARIEIADANRMILWEGSAVFHVPESARNFTVDTLPFRAVELGTEFAIRTLAANHAVAYVFQGRVFVDPASAVAAGVVLSAGQAVESIPNHHGQYRLETTHVDPTRFKREVNADGARKEATTTQVHRTRLRPFPDE